MENLRTRINVKLIINEKDYSKCTSKPSYMLHKIFDNNLVAICKSKLALKFNKAVYIGMCILDLKQYQCTNSIINIKNIKNRYGNNSRLFFTGTDCFNV